MICAVRISCILLCSFRVVVPDLYVFAILNFNEKYLIKIQALVCIVALATLKLFIKNS